MNIAQFFLKRALEETGKTLSELEVFASAEPTQLRLPSERVILSPKILDLGGRIEDWDRGKNEFYLYFPGKKFEAGIIESLDGKTYCLISFNYNQRIITISETEVDEIVFHDLPPKINATLMKMAYEEILLSLPK